MKHKNTLKCKIYHTSTEILRKFGGCKQNNTLNNYPNLKHDNIIIQRQHKKVFRLRFIYQGN